MKKLTAGLLIAALIIVSAMPAFAFDENKIITNLSSYTGVLFLSDWKDEGIVLKNVKPVIVNEENTAIAAQLEYTEIPAFGGNIKNGSNGEELDLCSLAWFLDMNVKVTVATLAGGGYRIVSITTI